MKEKEKNTINEQLTTNLKKYIETIINKYEKYIPKERLIFLKNINNYSQIIKIYDYKSINGMANSEHINLPSTAELILKEFKRFKGFGTNKQHKSYNKDTLLYNNNTFVDYLNHVFVTGETPLDYYNDLLLHETMHFCGSNGGSALKEGINELLTRKIALDYDFITNGCAYNKEIKIALQLEDILGEEVINQIAFTKSAKEISTFLINNVSKEAADLYFNIDRLMEEEFYKKYYKDMNSYNGLKGVYQKITNYNEIDYSKVYQLLEDYKKLQLNKRIATKK